MHTEASAEDPRDLELVAVPGEEGVWINTDTTAIHKRYLVDKAVSVVTGIDDKTLQLHRVGPENSALRPIDRGKGRRPRYLYLEFKIHAFARSLHRTEGGQSDASEFAGASVGALAAELQAENAQLKFERKQSEAKAQAYERAIALQQRSRRLDQEFQRELDRARGQSA
jgi:hypothetical protein